MILNRHEKAGSISEIRLYVSHPQIKLEHFFTFGSCTSFKMGSCSRTLLCVPMDTNGANLLTERAKNPFWTISDIFSTCPRHMEHFNL